MTKEKLKIDAVDNARAYLYGLFSLFFTFTYDKGVADEIIQGLYTVIENPINIQMERAAKRLKEKLEANKEALFDEYDSLFLSPSGDMLKTSASYFTEGIENGEKRLEMINFIIQTPNRKSKDYTDNEDDLGFILSFMSKIAHEGEKFKTLQKQVFDRIINVFIDYLLDEIYKSENSDVFKDVVEMMSPFIEFERLYFEIEKPKRERKQTKQKMERVLPYKNLKKRRERSEKVENETCNTGIEDEEPVEEID